MDIVKIAVLTALVMLSGCTTQSPAIRALKVEAPDAMWNEKTAVKADVTCDGITDTVMLGYEPGFVWIGLVPGSIKGVSNAKPSAAQYSIGKHSQDSFCNRPVRIKLYNHVCDGGEYGKLENCKPTPECKDFTVVDEECDSFHFFWDYKQATMSWWRN